MKLGLQIYSLRDYLTPDQICDTLKKVKDMGYDGIEWTNQPGYSPRELAEMTRQAGLEMFSLLRDIKHLIACDTAELDEIASLGIKYLPICWLPTERLAGGALFEETCELICRYGEEAKKRGIWLLYHNHEFDLDRLDGKPLLDHLFETLPADILGAEPDTCWLYTGKVDPAAYLQIYTNRAPIIHLKDCIAEGGRAGFKPVGSGVLDWKAILNECGNAEWICVEQDDPSDGLDAFACAELSAAFLRNRTNP